MKLICSKANLLSGVNTVSKAVPNKTTMSILECILIDASEDRIRLIANDTELGIETVITGIIEEKGKIALDAKILFLIALFMIETLRDQGLIRDTKIHISCQDFLLTVFSVKTMMTVV